MTYEEFDRAMKPFYAEFAFGGDSPEQRADDFDRHWRALCHLPYEAVDVAIADVIRTWTDAKARPRIGLVAAKAEDWLQAKLRGAPPGKLAVSECCRWCHAVAGTRRGSESRRLVVQHARGCRFHDPDVVVDVTPEPSP